MFRINRKAGSPYLSTDTRESYQTRYRWVMLSLASLLYAAFGVVRWSVSPLVTPILKDLNMSYSQMGLILGSWQLTYIVVAAIGGAVIDRWGLRKSLFVGILIIGLSEALRYFANGFGAMLLFVALFGLGGPMISIGCPKTISQWFKGKERGAAVGVYTAGASIGGLLAFSAINSVVMPLTGDSWRLTLFMCSLPAFAIGLLWWFMAREAKSTGAKESSNVIKVFTDLVRLRDVQLILIMGLLAFAISHGFTNWLPKLLETGGLPPAMAGFAASVPLIISIPAVIVVPRVVAPHLIGRVVALISLTTAIAVLMVTISSGVPIIIWLVLYGLSSTTVMPLLILALMNIPEVGSKYMGAAGGMFFCIAEIGGFSGPSLLGAMKDMTGSFSAGAVLVAALSLVIAVMALLLRTRSASEEDA